MQSDVVRTRRAALACSLLALLFSALVVVPTLVVTPTASAASHLGKVKLKVVTPRGVPATVLLKGHKTSVTVAKGAAPAKMARTLRVKPGTWALRADPVAFNDHYYVPTAPARVKVTAGETARVKVVWQLVKTANGLRITGMTPTQLSLSFTRPSKRTKVQARYAAGQKAPATVSAGKAAAVKGTTATTAGLAPGQPYAFGLFTKSGKHWVGPLALTATTKSTDTRHATYVVNPGTVIVTPGTDLAATSTDERSIRAQTPPGVTPLIEMPLVLPISPSLPGGFIGKVTGVDLDGQHITVTQQPLGAVFDYLDGRIPALTPAPGNRLAARSAARSAAGRAADGAGTECEVGISSSGLSVGRHLNFDGTSMQVRLAMKKYFGIPTSAGLKLSLHLETHFGASWTASISEAYACKVTLGELQWTGAVGPVPILFRLQPQLSASISGKVQHFDGAYDVTAGFDADVYIPTVGFGPPTVHADPFGSAAPTGVTADDPDPVTVKVDAKLGGELWAGPGVGTPGKNTDLSSGVVAGIHGELWPVDGVAEAKLTNDGLCTTVAIQGDAAVDLGAAVWLPGFSFDHKIGLWHGEWPYAGPWKFPQACGSHTYKIVNGQVSYHANPGGSCSYGFGECHDYDGGYTESGMNVSNSVNLAMSVNGSGGQEVTANGETVPLEAALNIDSWTHSYSKTVSYSQTPCGTPVSSTESDGEYDLSTTPVDPSVFNVVFDLDDAEDGFQLNLVPREGTEPRFGWTYPVGLRWSDSSTYPLMTVTSTGTGDPSCAPTSTFQASAVYRGPVDPASSAPRTEVVHPATYVTQGCSAGACIVRVTGSTTWSYDQVPGDNSASGTGTISWSVDVRVT